MAKWSDAQTWESDWWGSCVNTYGEEEKQWLYARKMLLSGRMYHNRKSPYNIDMDGLTVIDIGGGPVSLLLKCTGLVRGTVVDPIQVPSWVIARYEEAGIMFVQKPGEQLDGVDGISLGYDEAWIYNCLQHTANPKRIVEGALKYARAVRIFEWIETAINEGHPHSFTANRLDQWLGGEGKVSVLRGEANCWGKCYHGVFKGEGFSSD